MFLWMSTLLQGHSRTVCVLCTSAWTRALCRCVWLLYCERRLALSPSFVRISWPIIGKGDYTLSRRGAGRDHCGASALSPTSYPALPSVVELEYQKSSDALPQQTCVARLTTNRTPTPQEKL